MSKKVPRLTEATANNCNKPDFVRGEGKISFSFAALEQTEYFNLDGTCQNWAADLFAMLKNVSNHTKVELASGQCRTFRVHNHASKKGAKLPSPLPYEIDLQDFYQMRISTAKGGVHGIFCDDTFYVIWLDPLHNMYPDDRFGGLRKIKPPSTCCKERENRIEELQTRLAEAQQHIAELEQLCDRL